MPKISKQNRNFFRKWLPFNFCDRRCEKCFEMRDECEVYKKDIEFKLNCLFQEKDPDDTDVLLERMEKDLMETFSVLESSAKKENFELSGAEGKKLEEEMREKEKKIVRHKLYKKCSGFYARLRRFMRRFNPGTLCEPLPSAGIFWVSELEEVYFYSHLIFTKAARALHSSSDFLDDDNFSRPDHLVNASLGYHSLLTVEKSLQNIQEILSADEPIWASEISSLLEEAGKTKETFLEFFPEVEKYKNKIIFNGRLK